MVILAFVYVLVRRKGQKKNQVKEAKIDGAPFGSAVPMAGVHTIAMARRLLDTDCDSPAAVLAPVICTACGGQQTDRASTICELCGAGLPATATATPQGMHFLRGSTELCVCAGTTLSTAPSLPKCPGCSEPLTPDVLFCPMCGMAVPAPDPYSRAAHPAMRGLSSDNGSRTAVLSGLWCRAINRR